MIGGVFDMEYWTWVGVAWGLRGGFDRGFSWGLWVLKKVLSWRLFFFDVAYQCEVWWLSWTWISFDELRNVKLWSFEFENLIEILKWDMW